MQGSFIWLLKRAVCGVCPVGSLYSIALYPRTSFRLTFGAGHRPIPPRPSDNCTRWNNCISFRRQRFYALYKFHNFAPGSLAADDHEFVPADPVA